MYDSIQFPRQALPFSRKTKTWGRNCVLWGDSRSFQNYSPVRKAVISKKRNYDLVNGKIDMQDVAMILNPANIDADYIPEKIQHFPIMNPKLQVLIGEEYKRPFDWRAIVTNPNAVTEIEDAKKNQLLQSLRELVEDTSISEEDYEERLEELDEYYTYNWQDFREIQANELLKHYNKELNFPLIFNDGFWDGLIVGEELYQCDIIGGEPILKKLNPSKVRVYRSGHSNKIEDADVIIIEDYWSPGAVIDAFYDQLSKKDVEYLENLPNILKYGTSEMGIPDYRNGLVPRTMFGDQISFGAFSGEIFDPINNSMALNNYLPYDTDGNVRVMQMFWKSKRKVQKVKKYDPETGDETFSFYSETYVPDTSLGEESETMWINEAWEGTLIGGHNDDMDEHPDDGTYGIFVNIRPRPIQYSRLSNVSKCHFGIIGTIYNLNDDRPFSMVDMMKPYNYLYDVLLYRLADAISSSFGSLVEIDIDKIPDGWNFDKWLYFAKVNHLAVTSSFNVGKEGPAKGKIVGTMNNNTQRIINDASGNYIQQLINLAEYTKSEMGEIVGINRQREGQIANRETVGGVERATLQSSYITERYFAIHNDTKRRVLEAFLETAKIAGRGRKIKFQYITSEGSRKLMEIDGDNFAENDYGIVIDASSDVINLDQKIDTLSQAALQTQTATLSDIMRMWSSANSLAEKIRILQNSERKRMQQAQRTQEMQNQQQQMAIEAQLQQKQAELDAQVSMNSEDNETKILVAQIQGDSKIDAAELQKESSDGIIAPMSEEAKEKLREQIREFDIKIQQDNKKLALEKEKNQISRISAKKRSTK